MKTNVLSVYPPDNQTNRDVLQAFEVLGLLPSMNLQKIINRYIEEEKTIGFFKKGFSEKLKNSKQIAINYINNFQPHLLSHIELAEVLAEQEEYYGYMDDDIIMNVGLDQVGIIIGQEGYLFNLKKINKPALELKDFLAYMPFCTGLQTDGASDCAILTVASQEPVLIKVMAHITCPNDLNYIRNIIFNMAKELLSERNLLVANFHFSLWGTTSGSLKDFHQASSSHSLQEYTYNAESSYPIKDKEYLIQENQQGFKEHFINVLMNHCLQISNEEEKRVRILPLFNDILPSHYRIG